MQIGELSVVSAHMNSVNSEHSRESREHTVNGMQKIPEGGLNPSVYPSCSDCGSKSNNGKAHSPSSPSANSAEPTIGKHGHEKPLQLSLSMLSCVMVASAAVGALSALVLVRR